MMYWTIEREKLLRKLWNEYGMSAGKIAKEMGVTRNAIIGKVHRMGLNSRQSPIKRNKTVATKKPKPLKKVEPKREIFAPLNITLADMDRGMCYYPYGDSKILYCGHPAKGDYCPHHLKAMRPK